MFGLIIGLGLIVGSSTESGSDSSVVADDTCVASGKLVITGTDASTVDNASCGSSGTVYAGPVAVAGLVYWVDADISAITIATGVSQENDLSGQANHLTQSTGANQPTHPSNIQNGHSAILYDGVNDELASTNAIAVPFTRFVVCEFLSASGTLIDGNRGGTGNSNRIYRTGATQTSFHDGSANVDVTGTTPASFHVYTFACAGNVSGSLIRIDGTQKGTFATSSTTAMKPVQGTFGDGTSAPANGYVCADLVYSGVLSTSDMQTVEAYLKARYNTP